MIPVPTDAVELVRAVKPTDPPRFEKETAQRERLFARIVATPRMADHSRPSRRRLGFSTRRRLLVAVAVIAVAAAAGGVAYATHEDNTPIIPATLSALQDRETVVDRPPLNIQIFRGADAPGAGSVHMLGYGAYAWQTKGGICWTTSYAGGCLPRIDQPITWSIKDLDASGSGSPPIVFGLAVDGVTSVTVRLKDGSAASGTPKANFYKIDLPSGESGDDVVSVHATLVGNGVFDAGATR